MSCYEQLEATFPLAAIDIREFEARIKRLVYGKEYVTLKQLQYTLGQEYEDFEILNDPEN